MDPLRLYKSKPTRGYPESTAFPYPVVAPVFYVKFGDPWPMRMEAETHMYAFEQLQAMPRSGAAAGMLPRIPKILRLIQHKDTLFAVIEYIQGRTFLELQKTLSVPQQQPLVDKIAHGIRALSSMTPPQSSPPGPYRGGIIRHPLFKDSTAAAVFDSVDGLEAHINKLTAVTPMAKAQNPWKITLERELCLVYSDLYPGNFIFRADQEMYVIDFEHAAFLPRSFQTLALHASFPTSRVLAMDVAERLKAELPTENLPAMRVAQGNFGVCFFGFGM
ncbi:hypothetical protein LLEC1_04024 [Akanthomyces lecanii]|uniref:Aminoglycoside phosphotransferase domain-containing protein n=1 Tax=Cordyceps confragosa TaxID=2714763 RepID=A0A179IDG7_CORDF|nr:hypothetical protein LLEC1_04024 [Akanthomyces lecanii]